MNTYVCKTMKTCKNVIEISRLTIVSHNAYAMTERVIYVFYYW